ncbi:hypothetical protein ACQP2E_22790 [Actinoplanes sp. CA-015351]|uniref:hypothetical protein n=1 Tax=Actinoplanes sp. CA-015351 TaxID=3239897 RepID=UPI003D974155
MNVSTTGTPTLCGRCGQITPGPSGNCAHCGSPLARAAIPLQRGVSGSAIPLQRGASTLAGSPGFAVDDAGFTHRFPPASVTARPALSRRTWQKIGAAGAAAVLAVVAFVVFGPDAPTPRGTVQDYFDHLSDGDTAAALALVSTNGMYSLDGAPLLVPEVLADKANRPADLTVTNEEEFTAGEPYTLVTARYQLGEQSMTQAFAVIRTEDDDTPYRLYLPFVFLTVDIPGGMDLAVNGVAVDAGSVAQGTLAFPGIHTATTSGNALFAGATRAAAYESGSQGVNAVIDFGQLEIAAGGQEAVQSATQQYLDANCVNPSGFSFGTSCPLQAPSMSWSQTTSWAVTAYPQVQVSAEPGESQARFVTSTSGSADYTITYTEFSGAEKTETGTVPIDISGVAGIGEGGAIEIALGY